ncbi:hypothetical protein QQ008_30265 [Fulvivirgaceae bacterium BMA10]|uniref:Uncharacterized protein n=1 Tax=Splendidivirga corallicola TaxID=3051826 RepID=A0ABT8KZD2_9BACT|nr:hypothetical protein [Fulvivirgaceae bacterium BMA10]
MQYIENDFYPAWLPLKYRETIDLSELAEPTEQIIKEADALIERTSLNIAIYKKSPKARSNGLCSVFKSAVLPEEQLKSLYEAEQRLGNYVIVAYANPLEYHAF